PFALPGPAKCWPLASLRTAVDRRSPAVPLAEPHAVRDFRDHRAADRAMRADVLTDGDLRARGRRGAGLGPAHARERQCAKRGETAGGEARAAQESAAIETAIGLALQRAGEPAATSLTFRSLDQHGCLPQLGSRLTR